MPQSSRRRFVHRLSRPGLPTHSSILFAALVLMNISGYLFYVAMSRLLDAQTYGALGALIAVFTVVAIPANAIQAVVARRVAVIGARGEAAGPLLRRSLREFTIMGVVAGAVVASAARPVARYLHVRSASATALLGAYILVASITPVLRGALHGLVRYRTLSASLTMVAVLRLALGVVFVSAGWGAAGAAAAFVIAEAGGTIPCLPALRRTLWSPGRDAAIVGEVARACLAVAGFAAITNVDVVLARHYFPEAQSGLYAAAAVVGRAVLFGAMSLTMLAYPRFAVRRQDAHALLRWVLLGTFLIGGAATAFVTVAGHPLMRVVFGAAYGSASNVAAVSAASSAIFSVAGVLMQFEISRASARALAALPASVIEIGAIVLFHRSILEIAWVTVFGALVLVVASALLALRYRAAEADIAMSDLRML